MVGQLVKQLTYPSLVVSADNTLAAGNVWLSATWNEARLRLSNSGADEFLLVIDEIQKVDNWSEVLKNEWDEDTLAGRNLKVIILGSSRMLIQKGLTESLAGRFEITHLSHWTYREMRDAFGMTLTQYIWFGGYPGAASLIKDETRWKAYIRDSLIETSISKDVLMLSRVDKPALLKRLFEIGCLYSGQIIALNKIQGELQEKGNLTTLSNYLHLIDGAGMLTGIEKYSGDVVRMRASRPKFQVYNNALLSAQSFHSFQTIVTMPKEWGRYAESAVGSHLLNASLSRNFNLYYWNDTNSEVDFILEKKGRLIAIEVKTGSDKSSPGLQKFENMYQRTRSFIIGTGGYPLEDFLLMEPEDLFKV
jgi:predicted AAA+ superfamily ATPase